MGWLLEKINELRKSDGANLANNSTDWIKKQLQTPDNKTVLQVSGENFIPGKFYFLFYNMQGAIDTDINTMDPDQTSLMKKLSPIFLVDLKTIKNKKIGYGINLNFIPEKFQILFFDRLLELYRGTINQNEKYTINQERPFNINFQIAYKALQSIGYEYTIREYHVEWINKCFLISNKALNRFMTFRTIEFCRVDDFKLFQIWSKKLSEQDLRHQEMVQKATVDWSKIGETINNSVDELKKSLDQLNNL
jgi:hypothetical protein